MQALGIITQWKQSNSCFGTECLYGSESVAFQGTSGMPKNRSKQWRFLSLLMLILVGGALKKDFGGFPQPLPFLVALQKRTARKQEDCTRFLGLVIFFYFFNNFFVFFSLIFFSLVQCNKFSVIEMVNFQGLAADGPRST